MQKRRLSRKGFSAAGTGVTRGSSLACASQKARSSAAAWDTCGRPGEVHAPPRGRPAPRRRPRSGPYPSPIPVRGPLPDPAPPASGPAPHPDLSPRPNPSRCPAPPQASAPVQTSSQGALTRPHPEAPGPTPNDSRFRRSPEPPASSTPRQHLHALDVHFQLQLLHRLAGLRDLGHVVGHGCGGEGVKGRQGAGAEGIG